MVVVGYGQIIPQSIIDLPPLGIINVHASLLPKYRGAAPIQWAIANGETVTGVTTMRIDAGLDTGDMLLKAETAIGPEETAVELGARLAPWARICWSRRCRDWPPAIVPAAAGRRAGHLAPILKKEDGRIDWSQPAPPRFTTACAGFSPGPARTPPSAARRFTSGSRASPPPRPPRPPPGSCISVEAARRGLRRRRRSN